MIAQTEYLAHLGTLKSVAEQHQEILVSQLEPVTKISEAIKISRRIAAQYQAEFEKVFSTALAEIGNTTIDHYDKVLKFELSKSQKNKIVSEAIMRQVDEPYYGATLGQRVTTSQREMEQRIRRSANVGQKLETRKQNLTRIFLQRYPYGSQFASHQRIMLSQSVKLEHDIAQKMSKDAGVKLVKWTLSHRHSVVDICDDYATAVDPAVELFMKAHNIRVGPEGVYFIDEIPAPPHPNCQCTVLPIYRGRVTQGLVDRAVDKILELLGKFRKRRKK